MIVFGEKSERVSTRSLLRRIIATNDPVEQQIRFGQLEAAVADTLCPEADEFLPVLRLLRSAALHRTYSIVDPATLPEALDIRPAEGFAWYSLYPEQYAAAARRFLQERSPNGCVVVGIRSIGTTLSTVVEQTLAEAGCPVSSFTVRPHGHPFDRQLKLAGSLAAHLGRCAAHHFLIVDEGPGLSGSSITSVAEALSGLGVPDGRICLFPGHAPDPNGFVSQRARARWLRHPVYVEPFRPESYVPAGARDLSGGLWREFTGVQAPVWPMHERRKYLTQGELWKFSGLGHYGRARLERARSLAENGFVPRPFGLENGFLRTEWIDASPAQTVTEDLLDAMARYLALLAERYPTGQPAPVDALVHMMEVNTGRGFPDPGSAVRDVETVAVDGRMLPHEWLRSANGWVKADALDHHDDHLFPGCQDIAWDIAGAAVEFGFDPQLLAEQYQRLRRDDSLPRRLPFYRAAYAAFRIGFCTMAEGSLGDTPDGWSFRQLKTRYTAALDSAATLPAASST